MNIAPLEHTCSSPTINERDVDRLISEAARYQLPAAIPGKPGGREIGSRKILLVTVAGFPLGHSMTETKLEEIGRAAKDGATENKSPYQNE